MSLDLMGLLPLLLLDLPPTPPRFRGLNMRRRPAPLPPPDEDRDPDASDIDIEAPPSAPSPPPTLLFSRWNPSGDRMRGLRTLDRFEPSRFFFLDDDGGGDMVELLAILLVDEYAASPPPPPREGISNGDGAGPRDREPAPPRLATAAAEPLLEAVRYFMVASPKMNDETVCAKNKRASRCSGLRRKIDSLDKSRVE